MGEQPFSPIMASHHHNPIFLFSSISLLLLLFTHFTVVSEAQPVPKKNATLSPIESCTGVFLNYSHTSRLQISPYRPDDPANQPFAFMATAAVLNTDSVPLEAWSLHIGFPNNTVLVSASSSVPTDGSIFPYIVGQNGSDGASFSGYPNTDLKTAIETAGDPTQIQAVIDIVGTEFGVSPPAQLLPTNLSLDNPEFICPRPTIPVNQTATVNSTFLYNATYMYTCCVRNPKFVPNDTSPISATFLPRRTGDLTIYYDVIQSYQSSYLARVTISNDNPLGRLDNWRLSWKWMNKEFILKTQGATTTVIDSSKCIFGPQGQYYQTLDLSTVQNCDDNPVFLDLPLSMANDTTRGSIPFCCRNGTILPDLMDPSKSSSAFQLQVFKMPPDLNRTKLVPPQSWQITGSNDALNPTYKCGPPIRVSPTQIPDPSGLPTSSVAVATWQVVCNITRSQGAKPRCCVSFSGFYNDSVIPCNTCACGCKQSVSETCSATAPALMLPSQALLVPFENRTAMALAWAGIKHFNVPKPLPCGDNCGVSINWHVFTDYGNGWSAKITLFNWEDVDIQDWFAAVEMNKAYDGFEAMYSFNGSAVGNNTIFMQGLPGLNYLMRQNSTLDPTDPGKVQSVISFTKKLTPGIDVVAGDGFPSKVFFNGEQCSLPDIFPTSMGYRTSMVGSILSSVLVLAMSILVLMEL